MYGFRVWLGCASGLTWVCFGFGSGVLRVWLGFGSNPPTPKITSSAAELVISGDHHCVLKNGGPNNQTIHSKCEHHKGKQTRRDLLHTTSSDASTPPAIPAPAFPMRLEMFGSACYKLIWLVWSCLGILHVISNSKTNKLACYKNCLAWLVVLGV